MTINTMAHTLSKKQMSQDIALDWRSSRGVKNAD